MRKSTSIDRLGPYRIERVLGRGGMGVVYAGVHVESGEPAAVKILSPWLTADDIFRERFATEIESLKQLRHPNIVRLYGYGEEDGHLFYSMQLVGKSSLQDELARGRHFGWREVIRIAIDVCGALKHAHDRGVIHRDLKPANLLLDDNGTVKLSDFGIAKFFGSSQLTTEGSALGTADYMSPEQAAGQAVTHRCDLYSLGSVMYALLTGRPPFSAKSVPQVIHMLRYSDAVLVRQLAPDVPVQLERTIAELLEKEPERRVATALSLARRLEAMERALSAPDSTQTRSAGEDEEILSPDQSAGDDNSASADSVFIRPTVLLSDQAASRDAQPPPTGEVPVAEPSPADQQPIVRRPLKVPAERHFTTVEQEQPRAKELARRGEGRAWFWMQATATTVFVVVVALTAWYALRPPSADRLYQTIAILAGDGDGPDLIEAEPDIKQFLRSFPDDPRCGEIQGYQEELELYRLERRFELLARGLGDRESLSPVEQTYLEAIQDARSRPEACASRLEALLSVFGDQPGAPPAVRRCLKLARHQFARLRNQIDRTSAAHLAQLRDRLAAADELHARDRQSAEAIWQGIIRLYADKPWASEPVARARAALCQSPNSPDRPPANRNPDLSFHLTWPLGCDCSPCPVVPWVPSMRKPTSRTCIARQRIRATNDSRPDRSWVPSRRMQSDPIAARIDFASKDFPRLSRTISAR